MSNKKSIVFIILLVITSNFISCNNYRKTTILDFEFGMNVSEYLKHASDLEKSQIITNLNNAQFDYTIRAQDDTRFLFHVEPFIYRNARLSSIELHGRQLLNDDEKIITIEKIINFRIKDYDNFELSYTLNGTEFKKNGKIDFDSARKVSISAYKKQKDSFSINDGDFIFGKIGTCGS